MSFELHVCHELLEKIDAALDARAWGYPREISIEELRISAWYRMGRGIVFWLHGNTEAEGDLYPHLAVSPDVRGRWPRIGLHRALRVIGQLHNGRRLRVNLGQDGLDDVAAALRALGWYEVEGGLAISLVEGGDTWRQRSD